MRLGKLLKKDDVLQDYEELYIHDLLTKLKEDTKAKRQGDGVVDTE